MYKVPVYAADLICDLASNETQSKCGKQYLKFLKKIFCQHKPPTKFLPYQNKTSSSYASVGSRCCESKAVTIDDETDVTETRVSEEFEVSVWAVQGVVVSASAFSLLLMLGDFNDISSFGLSVCVCVSSSGKSFLLSLMFAALVVEVLLVVAAFESVTVGIVLMFAVS
ncbi:hypothetical protein FF38_03347 [Lucilia cuprina]|uniref:Uncharacterized protein n=1 Tax=Lucilia cuprina TaxID=7375 RepID=A0A0L0C644_LUCCU|nr:hypothetical protein FF38_03347 [Lucilia cuprina]